MAITEAGTLIDINTGGNADNGTTATFTVPADAEIVIVATVNFAGGGDGNVAFNNGVVTMKKGGVDTALTPVPGNLSAASNFGGAMWYMVLPDTGTGKTISWNWSGTTATDRTNNFRLVFFKGIDTASAVRDSNGVSLTSLPCTTPTLTAQSGDLIVAWFFAFNGGTEGTVDTWSNLTTLHQVALINACDGAFGSGSPSGNTTVGVTAVTNLATNFGGLVALVLKPAGGGGAAIAPLAVHHRQQQGLQ